MTQEQITALYQNPLFWQGAIATRKTMMAAHPEDFSSDGPAIARLDRLHNAALTHQPVAATQDFIDWWTDHLVPLGRVARR